MKLKKSLRIAFPFIEIYLHSASKLTKKIEVAWIEGGNKNIIWSKGKAETEAGHPEIIERLKASL
jgi:hypothetical protein